MARVLTLTLAAAAALVANAFAAPADIAGDWSFQTKRLANGCVIQGVMKITGTKDRFVCSFSTKETCGDLVGTAEQTCTAKRNGAKLTIKSTVIKYNWPGGVYAPDDFDVTIVSGAYMKGDFSSTHKTFVENGDVEFFRGDTPVS